MACLTDSELYLRYIIGEIDPEVLHTTPERHLRCVPALAQFIVDPGFARVSIGGDFDCRQLDREFVEQRCELVSRGYRRLAELESLGGDVDVTTYPLAEVIAKW